MTRIATSFALAGLLVLAACGAQTEESGSAPDTTPEAAETASESSTENMADTVADAASEAAADVAAAANATKTVEIEISGMT